MSKRAFLFGVLVFACLYLGPSYPQPTAAADKPVTVYLSEPPAVRIASMRKSFWPRFNAAGIRLSRWSLEVSGSRENRELFQKVGKLLQADVSGVPFTVIGNGYVIGSQDEWTTGRAIETAIHDARSRGAPTWWPGSWPHRGRACLAAPKTAVPETLTLPVLGQVNLKYLSLAPLPSSSGGSTASTPAPCGC